MIWIDDFVMINEREWRLLNMEELLSKSIEELGGICLRKDGFLASAVALAKI